MLLLLLLCGCNGAGDDYTAYFRGQVKNPRAPYLLFSRDNKIIDTIPLDRHNRFFVKFDSLTPGLYSFKHEPDYQYIYFDKNDSLVVSVDANNFDGSVVFSGRGDRKNNFMAELYGMHEKDRQHNYDIYSLGFKDFTRKIDSTYALREKFYQKRKEQIEWSKGFDFYASYRIKLNYYAKKEYYPYIHARRTGEDIRPQLPPDFYNFRKEIDFQDTKLIYFSPFLRYSLALVNNLAVNKTIKKGVVQENSLSYNINKLNIVDSVFASSEVKNQVLNNIAFAYMLEDQNLVNNRKFLQRYDQLSTDKSNNNEINRISVAIKQLVPGNKLPSIGLVDPQDKPFNITTDIDGETVIFFWTSCARINLEKMYKKIAELTKEHPGVNFIAINVDNEREWKKNMARYNDAYAMQLRATNFQALRDKWVFNKISRTIILNPDGTIKNAFTNLLDDTFSNSL